MKHLPFFFLSLCFISSLTAQQTDSLSENGEKNWVIKTIEINRSRTSDSLSNELVKLEKRIQDIDNQLKKTSINDRTKVDKLLERVQTLEAMQNAVSQNELNSYQGNYQSAIINLVAMERELKPLTLFNASKDFFQSLTETGNPTVYPGYAAWYNKFKGYVEENKRSDAALSVISSMVSLTGNITKATPLTGPVTQALFTGMAGFVNSLGSKKRELRAESEKMFELTMILSQFNHDKDQIENEWTAINKELEDLKNIYEKTLAKNLKILNVDKIKFDTDYSQENDAKKRLDYLNDLTNTISKRVEIDRIGNPKSWKENFHYEMTTIQSLKMRFGSITFRISENIKKYQELIDKYKYNNQIGDRVSILENRLKQLRDAFDSTFEPLDYINSASRMYKVN